MSSGSAGWHSRLLLADIFGDQVDIKIRGQRKFQTVFGSILGAIGILLIAAYSIGVVIDIIDVTSPEVSAEDKYDYENHSFDIANSELLPLFTLFDRQSGKAYQYSDLQKIIRPVAYFVDQSQDSKTQGPSDGQKPSRLLPPGAPPSGGGGGSGSCMPPPPSGGGGGSGPGMPPPPSGGPPGGPTDQSQTSVSDTKLVLQWAPCMNLTNKEPYSSIVNENLAISAGSTIARNAWCLEIPKNASLYKIRGAGGSSLLLRMQFFPCNSSSCYNSTVLDKVSVNMINMKRYLQYSNFSQPVQKTTQFSNNISLNTGLGSFYIYYLRTVKISSKTNWFVGNSPDQEFTDIVKESVFNFNRAASNCSQNSLDCLPFFTMEYRSSGIVTTHKRKYTELLTASSNIGGLKELVMVVGFFIYSWYNQIYQRRYLSSSMLNTQELSALPSLVQNLKQTDQDLSRTDQAGAVLQMDPTPTIGVIPADDTTNSTPQASPSRLASPENKLGVARVRPKSRSKSPGFFAKKPQESVAVELNPIITRPKINPPKVVLKNRFSTEEESLKTGKTPDRSQLNSQQHASVEEGIVEVLQTEAQKLAEDLMSVETLLSELASVRVLTRMLFSDHHKKLVPLVEIECRRRQQDIHIGSLNLKKEMQISQAIEVLKNSGPSRDSTNLAILGPAEGIDSLRDMYRPIIDRYFSELLFGPPEITGVLSNPSLPPQPEPEVSNVKSLIPSSPARRIHMPTKRLSRAVIPASLNNLPAADDLHESNL